VKNIFRIVPLVKLGFEGIRKVPGWVRKSLRYSALGLVLIAAPPLGWAGFLQLTGNVHTVEPHQLYRSAQLDGDDLEALVRREGIVTILNLRGAAPGEAWYDEELQATTAAGAQHLDLAMSATQQPDEKTLRRLIEILRTAPRPLLVHCNKGADRSGLAAALYELLDANKSPAEAARQLSFRYGHFPWLTSRSGAMDRTFLEVVEQQP
jgi:protein tyrosine/serine phosphatase